MSKYIHEEVLFKSKSIKHCRCTVYSEQLTENPRIEPKKILQWTLSTDDAGVSYTPQVLNASVPGISVRTNHKNLNFIFFLVLLPNQEKPIPVEENTVTNGEKL